MTKEDLQEVLDILNEDQNLRKEYLQAETDDERAAILKAATEFTPQKLPVQELNEEELGQIAGGSTQYPKCKAICRQCGWQSSGLLSPESAYKRGMEHMKETGHGIQVVAIC